MKRMMCAVLAVVLSLMTLPLAVFAEETVLYTAMVDVVSTESGYETCQVYFYKDDCYMFIEDIAKYTRSDYTVDDDVLTIRHGSRAMNIDLSTNTLTEDDITETIKTLRNGDVIVIHAYPILTYLGATCSVADGKLFINMPECTLWEGLAKTGNENDITIEVFGDKTEQKARLILNGILSILQSDLAHASGEINRREAALLITQIDLNNYISEWEYKASAEKKQSDLLSKAVELGEFTGELEDEFDGAETIYGVTLHAVENTLDNPKLFKEFKDCWEADLGIISTGFGLIKNLSNNKKAAEDAAAIFNTCSKYVPIESPFYRTVTGLRSELYNDTSKTVGAIFNTVLETLLNEGFSEMLELGGSEISLALGAGTLITNLLDGKKDAFAYATAETNAINLLYLKEEVVNALNVLADRILEDNYSKQKDIEDYRLLLSLYYRILIATNEQVEKMIVAQAREKEPEMAALISKLQLNNVGFAQNLYIFTRADGQAFPKIETISKTNKWDEDETILVNTKEVPNGLDGLGTGLRKRLLSGIQADFIQYYHSDFYGDFTVIAKDDKYGMIGYDGELLLPMEYDLITQARGEVRGLPYAIKGKTTYEIDMTGGTPKVCRSEGWPGGDMSLVAYWYKNEPVFLVPGDGMVNLDLEEGMEGVEVEQNSWQINSVLPVQKISGIKEDDWGEVPIIKNKDYALLDTKTGKLVSDFVYSGFDTGNGFSEGLLAVKKGDKWGFVDEKGNEVTDFIYDAYEEDEDYEMEYRYSIYTATNGYVAVLKDGKWGLIDTQGNVVVDTTYDGISQVNPEGLFWLQENGTWSLYQLAE